MSKKSSKKKDSAAIGSEIMSTASIIVDFMKQQVVNNLVTANKQGKIEVPDDQMIKICNYIDASMTTAFVTSSGQLENVIKKI